MEVDPDTKVAQFPDLFSPGSDRSKKKKGVNKNKSAFQPLKNPCLALNELKSGLEYKLLEQSGPVHMPKFKIAIELGEQTFTGEGRSKKQAKHAAALQCLQSGFIQIKDTSLSQQAMQVKMMENIDFTSDETSDQKGIMTNFDEEGGEKTKGQKRKLEESNGDGAENIENGNGVHNGSVAAGSPNKKVKISASDKNPVMLLNELRPGLKYDVEECATKRFVMTVTIDGQTFEGSGASKKLAKQACARMALTALYNLSFTPGLMCNSEVGENGNGHDGDKNNFVPGTNIPSSEFSLPQNVADKIGKLIMDKFTEVIVGQATQHSRRKVLAGVVMTTDGDSMEQMEVIAVTTGTKCVNGEHMSVNGNSLNDCHAEIVSRRCLLSYLYSQLEKFSEDPSATSIFVSRQPDGGGYKLKPEVRFHLYINTAPCGDARIFSPHEAEPSSDPNSSADPHPNRKARGQLRTKIESGEGTIPVKSSDGIQTWDGVLQGSRLLTMSCSDKLSRWNVVGIQGALLAHYIEPIYLYSVTLGSLFHPSHMFRAMVGRIQSTVENLPEMYKLNVPRLNLLSSPEVRQPGKAPNYSVNWAKGYDLPEVIDAMKGKEQEKGVASRMAKVSLFRRFLKLASSKEMSPLSFEKEEKNERKNSRKKVEKMSLYEKCKTRNIELTHYAEAKNASTHFQTTKSELFKAFSKAELGTWVKKPMEQDEFYVEISKVQKEPKHNPKNNELIQLE